MRKQYNKDLNKVIQIDEDQIKDHFSELDRGTVEETLNNLLDAEADQLGNAASYEQSETRKDTGAGHYERGLHTKAGEVKRLLLKGISEG